MVLRSQSLSRFEDEPLATIRFYCACGKYLYGLSTNIVAMGGWEPQCKKCGRRYIFNGKSIVAICSSDLELYATAKPSRKRAGVSCGSDGK